MEQKWYVTFKIKHTNAVLTGNLCDYYAAECVDEQQARTVSETLLKYRCVKYPRTVYGSLNTTGSRKRKTVNADELIGIIDGLESYA